MQFLVDECTGPAVARWLRKQGHKVFSVYDQARGATDDWIIEKAFDESWILVTNDKDFGQKVYQERHPHRGVVLLRLDNERTSNKIDVLRQLLDNHADHLSEHFTVVTEKQVRFARI